MIWLLGAIACCLSGYYIARPILRPRQADIGSTAKDLALYKDQLREVDNDLERGVLEPDDAKAARLEISRRILAADSRNTGHIQGAQVTSRQNKIMAALICGSVAVGSLALYAGLGNPGMPDQPLSKRIASAQEARLNRPSQEQVEAQTQEIPLPADAAYVELVEKLRLAVSKNNDDEEGWRLLALHEFRLGNYRDARAAQDRVMEIVGENATAKDLIDHAEIMIVATNGYVSPQAEAALSKALKADARDGRARYYSGLTMAQNGRADVAYRLWSNLLAEGPEDAPWITLIQSQIGEVARAAGITAPDADAPGPTADQIEAASDMTADDRQEMIRSMVDGLGERLATDGGTAQEWARMIRALGVLGETARASAIWNEAQTVFASNPAALTMLREAAQAAEVAQ